MEIQSIRIKSNCVCFGPSPQYSDVVEQRITISRTGRIWFSKYIYGDVLKNYVLSDVRHITIDKTKVEKMFELVTSLYENYVYGMCTDVGSWVMVIKDISGNNYVLSGPLIGEVSTKGIDVTDFIRKSVPIEDLWVFDKVSDN